MIVSPFLFIVDILFTLNVKNGFNLAGIDQRQMLLQWGDCVIPKSSRGIAAAEVISHPAWSALTQPLPQAGEAITQTRNGLSPIS
jgi:hypothetical protein